MGNAVRVGMRGMESRAWDQRFFDLGAGPQAACHLKVLEGQNNSTRTIAQTIPHPIHVMFGWAACHSRNLL
jgi:hypothetical protein